MCVLSRFNYVQLFTTLWTGSLQAPLSLGFSRPEYWSQLPFPSSGDLPEPGIEPAPLISRALANGLFNHLGSPNLWILGGKPERNIGISRLIKLHCKLKVVI